MRFRFAGLIFAAMAVPVAAIECDTGTPDFLVASGWSAGPHQMMGKPAAKITVHFKNESGRSIRMVDAAYTITTILGRTIGYPMLMPSVIKAAAGESGSIEVALAGTELLESHPDDIVVTICTRQVVYEDGTVETFE